MAALAFLVTLPLLALAAVAIRVSGRGPVIYRAQRAGLGGRPFTMFKLRTMRVSDRNEARITAGNDDRITLVGRLLRPTKIDELPQLVNVVRGEMALVGPRPEDTGIVDTWYTPTMWETLGVLPGMTSPGSLLYGATYEACIPAGPDAERYYVESVLPGKLALDLAYVRQHSLRGDAVVLTRTALAIIRRGAHPTSKPLPGKTAAPAMAIRATIESELVHAGLAACTELRTSPAVGAQHGSP